MVGTKKPKKKTQKTDKEQSERFKKAARELEAVGELNLIEAEERLNKALKKVASPKHSSGEEEK